MSPGSSPARPVRMTSDPRVVARRREFAEAKRAIGCLESETRARRDDLADTREAGAALETARAVAESRVGALGGQLGAGQGRGPGDVP